MTHTWQISAYLVLPFGKTRGGGSTFTSSYNWRTSVLITFFRQLLSSSIDLADQPCQHPSLRKIVFSLFRPQAGLRWTRNGAKDAKSLHVQSANGHVHASAVIANIVSAEVSDLSEILAAERSDECSSQSF